jgi:HYDIN/CFA65/VesB-like, Ig-like domain
MLPGLARRYRDVLLVIALTLAMLAATLVYSRVRFGSVSGALDYLNGSRVLVTPRAQQLGILSVGEKRSLEYRVTNWTGREVRVLGKSSSCTCTVVEELPGSIAPSETVTIRVSVTAPKAGPDLAGSVWLLTDAPADTEVLLSYAGRIRKND